MYVITCHSIKTDQKLYSPKTFLININLFLKNKIILHGLGGFDRELNSITPVPCKMALCTLNTI